MLLSSSQRAAQSVWLATNTAVTTATHRFQRLARLPHVSQVFTGFSNTRQCQCFSLKAAHFLHLLKMLHIVTGMYVCMGVYVCIYVYVCIQVGMLYVCMEDEVRGHQ